VDPSFSGQHPSTAQPAPSYYSGRASPTPSYGRTGSLRNEQPYRAANNSSPWQRGAGYDH
jgi:hypothetical protein